MANNNNEKFDKTELILIIVSVILAISIIIAYRFITGSMLHINPRILT